MMLGGVGDIARNKSVDLKMRTLDDVDLSLRMESIEGNDGPTLFIMATGNRGGAIIRLNHAQTRKLAELLAVTL